jgi:threonine 3-dehydrogenase
MKALVKKEAKLGLWLEEVPVPKIQDHEVLIKIKKTSICGTDVHIYKWDDWAKKTIPFPMVIGHEFMGEIAQVGKNVTGLEVGMRVSGEGHISCGKCPPCKNGQRHLCMNTLGIGVHRHGCFAEYLAIPAENVFPLPPTISDDLAAIFDPFGNAMHTAASFHLLGEDVLVTGAGPIGIMSAAIAKYAGAHKVVITDINDYRLDLAQKMGVEIGIDVSKANLDDVMASIGIHNGFTVGFEMSGSPKALSTLLEKARQGAHIALLGILPPGCVIDWDLVIFKMLNIKGIYGREIFSTWFKMVHLLESGFNLAPIITHHFPFDQFQKGFDVMMSGNSGKIILNWA